MGCGGKQVRAELGDEAGTEGKGEESEVQEGGGEAASEIEKVLGRTGLGTGWGGVQILTYDGFRAGNSVERRVGGVDGGGWGQVRGWRRTEEGGNKGVSLDGFP